MITTCPDTSLMIYKDIVPNIDVREDGAVRNTNQSVHAINKIDRWHYGSADRYGYRLVRYPGQKSKVLRIHRLVGLAFCAKPDGMDIIDHMDGIRHNNCASNIRWVTSSINNYNKRKSRTPGQNNSL